MKLLNSLFLLLIRWLVLYFSSVNCEIRSRLVFIRKVNVFQNANPRSYYRAILSAVILIGALLLVPIKVECTLLQDHCKFKI